MKIILLLALIVSFVYCGGGGPDTGAVDDGDVVVLSEENFATETANGHWLLEL